MDQIRIYALKGNILYSKSLKHIESRPNSFLVCRQGKVVGIFDTLPESFQGIPVDDWGDRLIIPGLVDLHLHAPQYTFRGLGMDLELLEWLNTHTFPEEAKYANLAYARKAYQIFANDLAASATTRACVFATIHVEATNLLMEILDQTGIQAMVGKVNMDRNAPEYLRETDASASIEDTERWLDRCEEKYEHVVPILTPRFTPACSNELMRRLGKLQKRRNLPVQSHLSENLSEINWVLELCPDAASYGEVYDHFGLFGGDSQTVMAHCVYLTENEIELMRTRGVFIAHCPQSNMNLSSGIAPIRRYLDAGLRIGLGTDIAAGFSLSVFRAMSDAVQASKLRWRLVDDTLKPLSLPEAFYLGTRGGGAFWGQVGAFEEGYEFDAVVIDDASLPHAHPFSPLDRLERAICLADDRHIAAKYIAGERFR